MNIHELIDKLISLPTEVEWVEFKQNYVSNEDIGEYISAISNAATLFDRNYGYMVWGVTDDRHEIVGTTFSYRETKVGNEELEAWLARLCSPRIDFRFIEQNIDNKRVVILKIPCATSVPIRFSGKEWIRVGSNKARLEQYPEKERSLWASFSKISAELRSAAIGLSDADVLDMLDYTKYCDVLSKPISKNIQDIMDDFAREKFIKRGDELTWDITNLGALLIGRDIKRFEGLSHKSIRVIMYGGNDRVRALQEEEFSEGYVFSFERIIHYILTIIPREEIIVNGVRQQQLSFPEIAIRELVVNMFAHQAIDQSGTYPTVEIFKDRVEFYNAGAPLVNIVRIVDAVPKSRNENMTGFMHKCGICEERGSGYDKIISATSACAMLAPKVEVQDNQYTKVTLFAKIPFALISKEAKVWTCYMQACLSYVETRPITNTSVRALFGLSDVESYKATRIINDTVAEGMIKPVNKNTAPRYMQYILCWGSMD